MQEMNQGEEYNEQGFEDEEFEYDESAENTKAGYDTFWGIPKKAFFIGIAVVVIALLALVLIMTQRKSNDVSEDDIVYPDAVTSDDVVMDDDTAVTSSGECYDSSGNFLGYYDSNTDGYDIYDSNYASIGIISSTGSLSFYDASGNTLGCYDPIGSDTDVEAEYSDMQIYDSGEDTVTLRKLGYTGDEIELAMSMGVSVQELIDNAQALRDQEAADALVRMSDSASDEFKYIVDNSIFCLPEITYDEFDISVDSSRNYTGSYVVNADYWKVPTYGYQLMLKCKIANDTYCYYIVTPERWATLPEEGNIVLNVSYTMYGTHHVNMYITDIKEVTTTYITVNSQDSARDLQDILSDTNSQYDYTDTEDTGYDGVNDYSSVNSSQQTIGTISE